MKCPNCDYQVESLNSLRIHAAKIHKLSSEDLYLAVVSNGERGICACGCGQFTKFNSLQKGYSEYILGHIAKIKNNWGHNPTAQEKSLKKRREESLWAWGQEPWNKGKTKENDPEFAKFCEKAYNSPEHKEKKSQHMKELWEKKIIVPLTGSSHPQWKGGTSYVGTLCHSDKRLYTQWKIPRLKECNFACVKCGEKQNLHVHHSEITMSEIISLYRDQIPDSHLSQSQKQWIVDQVIEHHLTQDVKGIALCEDCHKLEHANLNFKSEFE